MAAAMCSSIASRAAAQEVSCRGKPLKASAARPAVRVARKVSCSAEKQESAKQMGTAIAAAALAAAVSFGSVDAAYADVSGLTPCSESKAFAKREKNEIKTLTKRIAKYEAGSAPALALQATIERTERRFATYGKSGVLCGTSDGLPHLIADPGLAFRYGHTGEIFIPTLGFLYIAGWIGYVGRQYVMLAKEGKKPQEKEIIIDVPVALRLALQGAVWPLKAITELRENTLTEDDSKITVSPR